MNPSTLPAIPDSPFTFWAGARRAALLLTSVFLLAAPAYGQLQTAQTSNGFSGATKSLVLALPKATVSTGSWILVQVESTCTAAPTLKDSVGRTYLLDLNEAGTEGGVSAWHAVSTTSAATTITVTFVSCSYAAMQAEEAVVAGVDSKVGNATSALSGSTFTIGSVTATGNDFIVGAAHTNYGVGAFTAASGFTLLAATQSPAAAEYRTVTAAAYSVSFGAKTGYKYTGVALAYSPSGVTPPPNQTCSGTGGMVVSGSSTPPLTMLATFTMPSGTVGTAYSASVGTAAQVSGGVTPYTFALTSGSFPAGLTMTAGGVISGTPTTAGTSSFTITVTDSSGGAMNIDFHQKIELAKRLQQ